MKVLKFVLVLVLVGVGSAAADDVFRIQIGHDTNSSQEDLARRVFYLERAVYQLQTRVFSLESKPQDAPAASMTTCYIKTPFSGTVSSTDATETAARAHVLEKCAQVTRGTTFCSEDEVKCGK